MIQHGNWRELPWASRLWFERILQRLGCAGWRGVSDQVRRLLAIAAVLDGASRAEAAQAVRARYPDHHYLLHFGPGSVVKISTVTLFDRSIDSRVSRLIRPASNGIEGVCFDDKEPRGKTRCRRRSEVHH